MNQIEDTEASFLLIDVDRYRDRAAQLASVGSLKKIFSLGKAGIGSDLLEAAQPNVHSAVDMSYLGDVASLNSPEAHLVAPRVS